MIDVGSPQFMRHNNGSLEFLPDGSNVAAVLNNTSLQVDRIDPVTANTTQVILGNVTSSGSAIALQIGNVNSLNTSGDLIVGFYKDNLVTLGAWLSKDYVFNCNAYAINGIAFAHAEGTRNTAIGKNALSGFSGMETTGSGEGAGRNSSANYSQFRGYESGRSTNGEGHDASGYQSVYFCNAGINYLIAKGTYALDSCSGSDPDGRGRTGIGHSSGRKCEAGKMFLGWNSGYMNVVPQSLIIEYSKSQIPLIGGDFSNRKVRHDGDTSIFSSKTLGSEVLSQTDFTSPASNWIFGGDWANTDNKAVYTHSGGSGKLSQSSGSFSNPLVGNRFYKLQYVCQGGGNVMSAEVSTAICETATPLRIKANDTFDALIFTKVSPGNFEIDVTSTSGSFSIDDISLKELAGGDLFVRGNYDLIGDIQITGDRGSGKAGTTTITGELENPTSDPGWATSDTSPMTPPDGYFLFRNGTQKVSVPFWNT